MSTTSRDELATIELITVHLNRESNRPPVIKQELRTFLLYK